MHPVIIVLLIMPLLAVGILLIVRRSSSQSRLVPALVLSGIATALTTAFFAFTSASVPLAPYALSQGAWLPVAGQVLLALYIGFGIGVIIATLIGVPYQLLADRKRSSKVSSPTARSMPRAVRRAILAQQTTSLKKGT